MALQKLPHARQELVDNYPGVHLSDEQRRLVEQRDGTMEELMSDPALIMHALSGAMAYLVTSLLERFAAETDHGTALRIAREYGADHGERNYGRFLASRGYSGGTRAFAEFQDYGHTMLGPKHATGLFAEFDEEEGVVVITRDDCLYYPGPRGTPSPYLHAMESGIADGYRRVDPSFDRVENPRCLSKGDTEGCEHRCYFTV